MSYICRYVSMIKNVTMYVYLPGALIENFLEGNITLTRVNKNISKCKKSTFNLSKCWKVVQQQQVGEFVKLKKNLEESRECTKNVLWMRGERPKSSISQNILR